MVILLASLSALCYGLADFSGGLATRKSSIQSVVAWSQCMGIPVALLGILMLNQSFPDWNSLAWGAVAGLSGASGLGFLYKGLAWGKASVVSPVAAVTGTVLPVLFGLATGERPELLVWLGIAGSLVAVILLSLDNSESGGHALMSLRMGLIAGASFGGFFILLSRTSDQSGMWPLLSARMTSVPLMFLLGFTKNRSIRLEPGKSRHVALGAGVLDMCANLFYLLAFRSGILITASVVTALYPAPTVILQRIFFMEHLNATKIAGLILAVSGIALIGVGSIQ